MTEETEPKTNDETSMERYNEPEDLAIDLQKMEEGLKTIKVFQEMVHRLTTPGVDYGMIPGTSKPTLLKPGAEKIAKLMSLSDSYQILSAQEDFQKPFFAYTVKCQLKSIRTGRLMSEGLGSCNSMESKYRWRESRRKCPTCGEEAIIKGKKEYGGGWVCFKKQGGCGATFRDKDEVITNQKIGRIANDDICSQVNTLLKMAKKRALVDAALSAGRLSEIFTQDLDEMVDDSQSPNEESSQKPMSESKRNWQQEEPVNQQAAEFERDVIDQPPKNHVSDSPISEAQRRQLFAVCQQYSVTQDSLKKYLQDNFKIDTSAKILKSQYVEICHWAETGR
jgi:hypothetical protein